MLRVSVTCLAILGSVLLTACASARHSSDSVAADVPNREVKWHTAVERDHPLVGRIWNGRSGTFVDREALVDEAVAARFVLLGEKHDNEDHHLLQALLLQALIAHGRAPAVVMEMIDVDQNGDLSTQRAKTPHDSDALAKSVRWEERHWPPFVFYRPIVERALDAGLPLFGGNYPTKAIKALFAPGAVLDVAIAARLGVDQPLPKALEDALSSELEQAHCGALPASMIPTMVVAQRLRDASMAESLSAHGAAEGAVLIAGDGHVRRDRGVPLSLERYGKASTLSVAMIEVVHGETDPRKYIDATASLPPFDFVWFTPRVDDDDPCAAMKSSKSP